MIGHNGVVNPSQHSEREACSQGRPSEREACSQGRPSEREACSQGRPSEREACSQGRPSEREACSQGRPNRQAAAGDQPTSEASPRQRRTGLLAAAAGVTLVLDVLSKIIVVAALEGHRPVKLLYGALYLEVFRNSGAAFSLGTRLTWG